MRLGAEYRRVRTGNASADLADGVTFVALPLVAGFAFWRLRGPYRPGDDERAPRPPGGFRAQIREGAGWALRHTVIRTLIVVGGLAGSAVAGPLRRRAGYARTIIVALLLGAASFATIAATTDVRVVAVVLAAYIGHAVIWNVMATSIRQKATPAAVLGRVGSVGRLVSLMGLAGGAAPAGRLASAFGHRTPFAVAAVLFAAGALLVVAVLGAFRAWETDDDARAVAAAGPGEPR